MAKLVWTVSRSNRTDLQRKLLDMASDRTTLTGVNQIIADATEPYVPFKNGNLREHVKVGYSNITWDTKYARYLYYGIVYGPNYPITRGKGENREVVGFFSPKGKGTKYPTYENIKFHWPGTTSHWVGTTFYENRRSIQQQITNYLKRRVRELGL